MIITKISDQLRSLKAAPLLNAAYVPNAHNRFAEKCVLACVVRNQTRNSLETINDILRNIYTTIEFILNLPECRNTPVTFNDQEPVCSVFVRNNNNSLNF